MADLTILVIVALPYGAARFDTKASGAFEIMASCPYAENYRGMAMLPKEAHEALIRLLELHEVDAEGKPMLRWFSSYDIASRVANVRKLIKAADTHETLQPASNERLSDTNLRNIRSWAENHLEFSSDDSGPRMIAEAMDELLMRRRAADTCEPREAALQRAIDRHVRWRETALTFLRQVIDGRGTEDEWPALAKFIERSDSRMVESTSQKANSVETLPKLWTMGGDLNGTHLVGYANVLYSRIVEVFGEPTETDFSEGSRVVFNWTITFVDGTIASIYEYKSSSLYGDGDDAPTPEEMKKTFMDWHIGGKSQRAVELVTNALSEEVR